MHKFFETTFALLGGTLGALISVPQAWRCFRVSTEGVASKTYQLLLAVCSAWIVYAIHQHLWVAFASNVIVFISTATVLALLYRDRRDLSDLLPVLLLAMAVDIGFAALRITWILYWATVMSIALRYPQLQTVRKSEDFEGVSVGTWLVSSIANFCWAIYGIIHPEHHILFSCSIIGCVSLSLALTVSHKRRRLYIKVLLMRSNVN